MPRPINATNKSFYHYEVTLDNERTLKKTLKDICEMLGLAQYTVCRKLKDNSIILRKYKDRQLEIKRIQKPIFKTIIVQMDY